MIHEDINKKDEVIQKIKELVTAINFCFFCTDLVHPPVESTPMRVQEVDDQGYIWFIGSKDSEKYRNIKRDEQVQLYFSDPSAMQYLSLFARAEIVDDQKKVDQYWSELAAEWFENGRHDPNIILFKVKPVRAHYWDTKYHKLESYAVSLINAIGGDLGEQEREGDIQV